jgi:hypothetical protein
MFCVYDANSKKVAEFKTKEEAEKYAIDNHDDLMKKDVVKEESKEVDRLEAQATTAGAKGLTANRDHRQGKAQYKDDNAKSGEEKTKEVDAMVKEDNTNDVSDDGDGLDKVQPKAVKKKFKDRKDKDIDNDGDVDDSDEYLHKRRKAVSKALAKEAYSKGMVQKAVEVAKKMAGNMTKAVKEIEKMQKGLSKDKAVMSALQSANEEVEK